MSEPNYHEIDAAIAELDEQIETLQTAKRDLWKSVRDEHGKKLADQIKLAVKLNRMDGEKRVERDEIEEGAFRILSILQGHRAPRGTPAREKIEQFPPHDPETGELTDTQEQPETALGGSDPQSVGAVSPRVGNEYAGTSSDENPAADAAKSETMVGSASAQITPSPETPQTIADDEAAPPAKSSATLSPSAADILPGAVKAPEAGSSSPASGAVLSKPDCLKLKDGHCKISFQTSALCSECNRAKAEKARV